VYKIWKAIVLTKYKNKSFFKPKKLVVQWVQWVTRLQTCIALYKPKPILTMI